MMPWMVHVLQWQMPTRMLPTLPRKIQQNHQNFRRQHDYDSIANASRTTLREGPFYLYSQ
jgi:hypothetical protein